MPKTFTYRKLRNLEQKINQTYNKTRSKEFFFESKQGYKLQNQWNEMMINLRGWSDYRWDENSKDLTKPEWIEYCNKSNLYINYNLGDVCA